MGGKLGSLDYPRSLSDFYVYIVHVLNPFKIVLVLKVLRSASLDMDKVQPYRLGGPGGPKRQRVYTKPFFFFPSLWCRYGYLGGLPVITCDFCSFLVLVGPQ